MLPAYWIVNVTVTDPDAYALYRAANAAPLAAFGASFLVRGGPQQVTEGELHPRTVVVRFPSLQAAVACYQSAEYQAASVLRRGASVGTFCIVEGYEDPLP